MSIQILCYNMANHALKNAPGISVSSFSEPAAFDAFDLVVIDLQQSDLWRNNGNGLKSINSTADFLTLSQMIEEARDSKIIVLLPINYIFYYSYSPIGSQYMSYCPLKDMLGELCRSLLFPLLGVYLPLAYGRSDTRISGDCYVSDFHLAPSNELNFESLTTSEANVTTSFKISERLYATTLLVEDNDALLKLCDAMSLIPDKQDEFPEWLSSVPFLDEEDLRSRRTDINNEISKLKRERNDIDDKLKTYEEKKSILCIKDKALEDCVRNMLAEMLHVPNDFEDTKEEDFRYETEDTVYLFEIKGSVGGLKRQHISRTNDHVQICFDNLEDSGQNKRVKGTLIFSSQINNPPNNKDPYSQLQLTLAEREDIGVMSAKTFLHCYEASMRGLLSPDEFISLISSSSGQIEYSTQESQ